MSVLSLWCDVVWLWCTGYGLMLYGTSSQCHACELGHLHVYVCALHHVQQGGLRLHVGPRACMHHHTCGCDVLVVLCNLSRYKVAIDTLLHHRIGIACEA